MHKRWLNHAQLDLLLEPEGGLLIKAGQSPLDPARPDMSFVRTLHPEQGVESIYLPGSSLKGVIRSHAERLLRSALGEEPKSFRKGVSLQGACDPLGSRSCSKRIYRENQRKEHRRKGQQHRQLPSAEIYRRSCLACRTFGHTHLASRFLAADAFPQQAVNRLPLRQGVAISRKTGASKSKKGALYDLEVAPTGTCFLVRLHLRNFELWQLGLVAQVLEDMDQGWVRLGFGKSRGLGRVRLREFRLQVTYPLTAPYPDEPDALLGVAALAPDLRAAYGLLEGSADLPAVIAVPAGQRSEDPAAITTVWGTAPEPRWPPEERLAHTYRQVHAVLQEARAAWQRMLLQTTKGGAL